MSSTEASSPAQRHVSLSRPPTRRYTIQPMRMYSTVGELVRKGSASGKMPKRQSSSPHGYWVFDAFQQSTEVRMHETSQTYESEWKPSTTPGTIREFTSSVFASGNTLLR